MEAEKLQSLPLQDIRIDDAFWSPYIQLVEEKVIPYQWEILNDRVEGAALSHCIENFKIAAGKSEGQFYGAVFQDTDAAKWLEAVAYRLTIHPDRGLEDLADKTIDLIGDVQGEDGYINTYYTLKEPDGRWSNLMEGHELYTAGHLMEAAVAYYQATGKQKFLNIMCRFADYICEVFGRGRNQIQGYPGHPEVELALVRMYEVTGKRKYLDQAKYFVDQRGQVPNYFDIEGPKESRRYIFPEFATYDHRNTQSHLPVRDQKEADGHAVRAAYLYCAMADLAFAYQDESLLQACRTLFQNIIKKRMFITGGIGSCAQGECFTSDYDLPNESNYAETCAAIGLSMFALRMFQIEKDGIYMEAVERALYNNLLSGISLTGTEFFYVNPLEVIPQIAENNLKLTHVKTERQKWFGVACCPPNIARTLTSLGKFIYSVSGDALFMNLYISNETNLKMGERNIYLKVESDFPKETSVKIELTNQSGQPYDLALRLPLNCEIETISLNGKEQNWELNKGYLYIHMMDKHSEIRLEFKMEPIYIEANPNVASDVGKIALMRGPVVYCFEEADNGGNLADIFVNVKDEIREVYDKNIFEGTLTLCGKAKKISLDGWSNILYKKAVSSTKYDEVMIKAVPYCIWNNRGKGEMRVWIHRFLS